MTYNFVVHSNEMACRKKGTSWAVPRLMENMKFNGFKGYGNHTEMHNTTLEKYVSQTKGLKKIPIQHQRMMLLIKASLKTC